MLAVGVRRQLNSYKRRHLCSGSDRYWEHCFPGISASLAGIDRSAMTSSWNNQFQRVDDPQCTLFLLPIGSESTCHIMSYEISGVVWPSKSQSEHTVRIAWTVLGATVTDQWVTSKGIEVSKSIMCSVKPVHVNLDHSVTVPQSKNACRLLQCRHTKFPNTQQV